MRFADDNSNTETADIFNSQLLNTNKKKCVFLLIIQIHIVRSFRIWILGRKTANKMRFAPDNPNAETADYVGSFRI